MRLVLREGRVPNVAVREPDANVPSHPPILAPNCVTRGGYNAAAWASVRE
jgi:hypothetical protein